MHPPRTIRARTHIHIIEAAQVTNELHLLTESNTCTLRQNRFILLQWPLGLYYCMGIDWQDDLLVGKLDTNSLRCSYSSKTVRTRIMLRSIFEIPSLTHIGHVPPSLVHKVIIYNGYWLIYWIVYFHRKMFLLNGIWILICGLYNDWRFDKPAQKLWSYFERIELGCIGSI